MRAALLAAGLVLGLVAVTVGLVRGAAPQEAQEEPNVWEQLMEVQRHDDAIAACWRELSGMQHPAFRDLIEACYVGYMRGVAAERARMSLPPGWTRKESEAE